MRIFISFIFILLPVILFAQKKRVCLSYDDLPVVSYGILDSGYQKAVTKKLVDALVRYQVPAIGFVNEMKLHSSSGEEITFQKGMLQYWVDKGLELGNHTYSHPDYNRLSCNEFSAEIQKGEKITKQLLEEKGKTMRYFRHPFLHTGDTKEKSDSLTRFLVSQGYTVAPVTLDNDDYLFALAYKRASVKGDTRQMQQIGQDYIAYMERKLKYFEIQAKKLFGRDISHIQLVHASLLNADYAEALINVFVKNNYEFVSLEEALKDPAYQTEVSVFGKWGISWIDRWALSKGVEKEFFKNDPVVPDYIVKLAQ